MSNLPGHVSPQHASDHLSVSHRRVQTVAADLEVRSNCSPSGPHVGAESSSSEDEDDTRPSTHCEHASRMNEILQ